MGSDPLVANVAASSGSLASNALSAHKWSDQFSRSRTAKASDHAEISADGSHFVSSNPEMLRIRRNVEKIAQFDIPVLILGETGTGKEVLAREIHNLSTRVHEPFLKVNCAALPEALLESELFGYERGAFTGAARTKPGQFEMCHRGTILLDEIAEMPPVLQAKLLHVLQDKTFSRLGGHDAINVDVRVIAATNVDIAEAIRSQKLREDLYYRLNAFTIQMPPLRSRCDEIPQLLRHFAKQFACDCDCAVPTLSRKLINACLNYPWPGNVRELRGFVQRLLIQRDEEQALLELGAGGQAKHVTNAGAEASGKSSDNYPRAARRDLKALGRERKCAAEKAVIARVLRETHYNRKVTAQRLQISYKALFYKIHQYGLVWKADLDDGTDIGN